MKVSVNWMQRLAGDVKLMPKGIDELVDTIGAQLGAVEEVVDIGKKYQNIVIALIVSCQKHSNADKLNVCKIDDGGVVKGVKRDENGYVQVVCGAPNVRVGLMVAWLPPGATVPSSYDNDPFVLEARELRGEMSNGMLASAHELALSDDHDGIIEITEAAKPGDDFARVFGLDDYIIDIENKMFTHRPDCFGLLGVARELAGIQHESFKSPDWYLEVPKNPKPKNELPLKVTNEVPALAPRVMAVAIDGINIKSSPVWIQAALARVGIRSINNIVDITNYLMHLTGQPMHAFDYHKIKKHSGSIPTLGPRLAKEGEDLTLLGAKKLRLAKSDIVIATDKKAVDLAGVMGGADTEVDDKTTAVILTVCSFDMFAIRRSVMRHGVFTDASTRYTKNQSALQNDHVLAEAMKMIDEHTGSHQASEIFDIKNKVRPQVAVHVTSEFINVRLGLALDADETAQLLRNVEFSVSINGPTLAVTPPFWRTDIEIPEDIVEEIGRLYGYDHLPLELPKRDLTPVKRDELLVCKQKIRKILSKAGANELVTYSFVHGNLLDKVGQNSKLAFEINNALSPDLQYYRVSLTPSLLDKVHLNIKAGYDEFAIFEIGKAHIKGEVDVYEKSVPKEVNSLSLIFTANDKARKTYAGAPFYLAKKYLGQLIDNGTNQDIAFEPLKGADLYKNPWIEQMAAPYDPERSAVLRDKAGLIWGVVGEFKSGVRSALKLPVYTAGFEVDPLLFVGATGNGYKSLSRFPKVQQDMTLKVPAKLQFSELMAFLDTNLDAPTNTQAMLTPIDVYQGEDKTSKNVTFRLNIASFEKTMTDQEVNSMLDNVADKAKGQLGAERI